MSTVSRVLTFCRLASVSAVSRVSKSAWDVYSTSVSRVRVSEVSRVFSVSDVSAECLECLDSVDRPDCLADLECLGWVSARCAICSWSRVIAVSAVSTSHPLFTASGVSATRRGILISEIECYPWRKHARLR